MPVLYPDIIRDILVNFDRVTLCRLQIVNKRFNLIIVKQFTNAPPYLILDTLFYESGWRIRMQRRLTTLSVTFTVLQATKFIRTWNLFCDCDEDFTRIELSRISHIILENAHVGVFFYRT